MGSRGEVSFFWRAGGELVGGGGDVHEEHVSAHPLGVRAPGREVFDFVKIVHG